MSNQVFILYNPEWNFVISYLIEIDFDWISS